MANKVKNILIRIFMIGLMLLAIERGYFLWYLLGMMVFGCFMHREWLKNYCMQWKGQFDVLTKKK